MKKVIHYCWFGGKPKPKVVQKCMKSWAKFCSNYEIIEWNESNFDVHCCQYVEEAYNAKKWAFVSDYARFWILYHYGGIYLDTDVELLKPLKDLPDAFVGFETKTTVASGLIRSALKGDELCEKMLQSYHEDTFANEKGELNLKTVCDRETEILEQFGLKRNGELQTVKGTTVFPVEYFCPIDIKTRELKITENTYSIHHYQASWEKRSNRLRGKIYFFLHRVFGHNFAEKVKKVFGHKKKK